ncbi:glycoside hydrolase family 43 protein [Trichoderma sp. SZMC 28011]
MFPRYIKAVRSWGCCLTLFGSIAQTTAHNSSYFNPVLAGWHSDPSCTVVDDTFYCVTSTFISFPGLPIYASKDLVDWKLVSHAWNRESQLPGASWGTPDQQNGMYAATIRHHDGEFFVICQYLNAPEGNIGVIFKSSDPYSNVAWSDPVRFKPSNIDPDLFWDDDGKVYSVMAGITLQEIDLETGDLSQPPLSVWNGTGGTYPEGPHLYKKDDWYYLMIAEGGTELNHSITIARSRNINGPYDSYVNNPILTARGTDDYFQTVGHGDLFQDQEGNWWGMCLSTRSGPDWSIYPMGREAVLFPATWNKDEWPILQRVKGKMNGWRLPPRNRDIPGTGPFNDDPDRYEFRLNSTIPPNLVYWRVPRQDTITTSNNGLRIVPSRSNLTGVIAASNSEADLSLSGRHGLSFIGRRQTHTIFDASVDLSFSPKEIDQEAGVTMFLTQFNHVDLGLVLLQNDDTAKPSLFLRFRAISGGSTVDYSLTRLPDHWGNSPLRLEIQAHNTTHFTFSAMPSSDPHKRITVGAASGSLLSGNTGPFTGSLVGMFATCNGAGNNNTCPDGGNAYFQNWEYTGIAQYISNETAILL